MSNKTERANRTRALIALASAQQFLKEAADDAEYQNDGIEYDLAREAIQRVIEQVNLVN